MPKDIRVKPVAGQRVIIDPVEPAKILRTVTSKAKDLQSTYISGTYVEPVPPPVDPPVEPPPVEPPPVEPPPVEPPPVTGLRPIYGFGSQVTGGTGKTKVHVTTLSSTGSGSLAYLAQGSDRHIVFDVAGTINLPDEIQMRGSNITIDGSTAPGPGITLTGDELAARYGARNIIISDIRHRGGGTTDAQDGDCISIERDVAGVLLARLSLSGANDETIGLWDRITDVTIQDCILGPHAPASMATHNFAALFGSQSRRISFHHNLIFGSNYRNPAVGWEGDVSYGLAPELVGDVVCNLIWDYIQYGTSVYNDGKGNVIKNYYQGRTSNVCELSSGAQGYFFGNVSRDGHSFPASNVGTRFTVPAYAVVPEDATALAAARSVLANAGCRVGGLDAYDQNLLGKISL